MDGKAYWSLVNVAAAIRYMVEAVLWPGMALNGRRVRASVPVRRSADIG
jgi:hypothetical protein